MYYHRVIVNFKKTATAPYFLHLFVDIEKNGNELGTYPANWIGNYTIAYGILGSVSNIDADKVYDYHTAYTIQPTKMVMNVDLDMNNKKLLNFKKKKEAICDTFIYKGGIANHQNIFLNKAGILRI